MWLQRSLVGLLTPTIPQTTVITSACVCAISPLYVPPRASSRSVFYPPSSPSISILEAHLMRVCWHDHGDAVLLTSHLSPHQRSCCTTWRDLTFKPPLSVFLCVEMHLVRWVEFIRAMSNFCYSWIWLYFSWIEPSSPSVPPTKIPSHILSPRRLMPTPVIMRHHWLDSFICLALLAAQMLPS